MNLLWTSRKHSDRFSYDGQGVLSIGTPGHETVVARFEPREDAGELALRIVEACNNYDDLFRAYEYQRQLVERAVDKIRELKAQLPKPEGAR